MIVRMAFAFGMVASFLNSALAKVGVDWEQSPAGLFSARYEHSSVIFNDKLWVIGGYDDNYLSRKMIWNSADGVTWNSVPVPFVMRSEHTSVVFKNKIWVIGGDSRYYGEPHYGVWSSEDGQNWTPVTTKTPFTYLTEHT